MKSFVTLAAAVSLGSVLGTGVFAATVDPTFGTFGDIDAQTGTDVTFGGDGIPTDATNYASFFDAEGNELLLGLSITPRFDAPVPTNDGAGTYTVSPGVDDVDSATFWNFSFFAELIRAQQSTLTIEDIGLELLYDLDRAAGTQIGDLGIISGGAAPTTVAQGSQNITFGFLAVDFPGTAILPGIQAPGTIDIDADSGEYSFLIRATNFGGGADAGVGVIAVAGDISPVPLPAGLPLLLAGLGGFVVLRRRQRS